MKRKISYVKEEIDLKWKEKYLTELKLFQEYQAEIKQLEKRKKLLKSEQEKKLILNIQVQGILSAMGRIVTKIENAVQTNSRLKTVLEGIIKIEATG